MKKLLILLILFCDCVFSQVQKVGGSCEDCELIYEGMPKELNWQIIMADAGEPGERMEISGIIYQKDGKKPAAGVILYVYHTDVKGEYTPAAGQVHARKHGHLRGWVQTDAQGHYKFNSIRPAAYPIRKFAAHIHPIIKEPGKNEYWIDEYQFEGDSLLTQKDRDNARNRGGSGIITLTKNEKGTWIGKRDIVLGKNVPDWGPLKN
ncbi:dioxygenase family protein [Runella slithyformis]|uniref:Intradiol ring-cleavage dioxygenase n=1 Tax=Runella slithyformis (strain ATCC 29530 / DSM 19594 / LMG 11500 / NCIMB 11436 / LSU 4) TaxID=761193 RepID=A0A7U3ZLS8_RUNSL|nr:intradiol ring-cleavage dioxygenase [Runella slithyformis]AEI49547.1 intradiol ring-cleavage dioxygenase [Runella slithyformis DSM 19594]